MEKITLSSVKGTLPIMFSSENHIKSQFSFFCEEKRLASVGKVACKKIKIPRLQVMLLGVTSSCDHKHHTSI